MSYKSVRRSVLMADLCGYTTAAFKLQRSSAIYSPESAIHAFDERIAKKIKEAVTEVGIEWNNTDHKVTNGDMAMLIFESATIAHCVAEKLHHLCEKENKSFQTEDGKLWFSCGIATGDIIINPNASVGWNFVVVARLEAKADKGEILIDEETYNSLNETLHPLYSEIELVKLKNFPEEFPVRRYKPSLPTP